MNKMGTYYKSSNKDFNLIKGDCTNILSQFEFKFDMIVADPPYFLSNGGISISSGKIVCVDKGEWDKPTDNYSVDQFNREWISICRDKLKENGTIWVSGTYHNIFSVAKALNELNFKILNIVTWAKTDPPENLSHRMLTHSSELIIWAKKSKSAHHKYNYDLMYQLNNNKQMTDVWYMSAVHKWEKTCGKHPTQKPLALISRIILASTKKNDWILDPFCGSGTTGIAASLLERNFLGIEKELNFLDMSAKRRTEINNNDIRILYQEKILSECHTANSINETKHVLIGRIGSFEQWEWLNKSHEYNLPISKILSMPKLLEIDYFLGLYDKNIIFLKVGRMKPQLKTKEQIKESSMNKYSPKRDNTYWVLHLIEDNSIDLKNTTFKRSTIISKQEERGAYWIRELDEVRNAFK